VNRWNFNVLSDVQLTFLRLHLTLLVYIRDKFFKKVSYKVYNAQSSDLIRRQRHQIKPDLFGIKFASFLRYLLLLDDRSFQSAHPLQDIPVTRGKLIRLAHFYQLV